MLDGTIAVFDKIDPYFGSCLRTMEAMGHLDLESKEGKAPGGYNYPLYEIGVPYIFMNAVGAQRDLVTMVHEGGHAVHSFLSRDLKLTSFKNVPSEVAELASMSMELLSMKYWDAFYSNPEELNRAKREQLEGILKKGQVVLLHSHNVHGSETNTSNRMRRNLLGGYFKKRCKFCKRWAYEKRTN